MFPENLFQNSMAFYVQNLEKKIDDLMSSFKKEKNSGILLAVWLFS